MSNLDHRLRMLEAEILNAKNRLAGPRFRVAKYSEDAVDHLLAKYGCKTLAQLDEMIADLYAHLRAPNA